MCDFGFNMYKLHVIRDASILFDHMTKCSFMASANQRTTFDQMTFQSMWLTAFD